MTRLCSKQSTGQAQGQSLGFLRAIDLTARAEIHEHDQTRLAVSILHDMEGMRDGIHSPTAHPSSPQSTELAPNLIRVLTELGIDVFGYFRPPDIISLRQVRTLAHIKSTMSSI